MPSTKGSGPTLWPRGSGGGLEPGGVLYGLQHLGRPGSTLGAKKGSLKMYFGAPVGLWVTDSALQGPGRANKACAG